ncbi:MAG: hypothetical protein ABFS34_11615 [Gemmatimonadota bacterium]
MGGCLRRILTLAVLIVAGAVAYLYFGGDVRGMWEQRFGGAAPELDGPALAAQTMARIEALSAEAEGRLALSDLELQSLIDHEYADVFPGFVASPTVDVADGRVRLGGRVATEFVREYVDLGDAAAFLPDTADVSVRGHLIPAGDGRVGLAVDQITAARIPLPDALVGRLLRSVGAGVDPELGGDVIPVALPEPLQSAYVHGDSLVLTGRS